MAGQYTLAAYCYLDSMNLSPGGTYKKGQTLHVAGRLWADLTCSPGDTKCTCTTIANVPGYLYAAGASVPFNTSSGNKDSKSLDSNGLNTLGYQMLTVKCDMGHPTINGDEGITMDPDYPHNNSITTDASGVPSQLKWDASQPVFSKNGSASYTFPVTIREKDDIKPDIQMLVSKYWGCGGEGCDKTTPEYQKWGGIQVLPDKDTSPTALPAQFLFDVVDNDSTQTEVYKKNQWGLTHLFVQIENEAEGVLPLLTRQVPKGSISNEASDKENYSCALKDLPEVDSSLKVNSGAICLGPCADGSAAWNQAFANAVQIPLNRAYMTVNDSRGVPQKVFKGLYDRIQGRIDITKIDGGLRLIVKPLCADAATCPIDIELNADKTPKTGEAVNADFKTSRDRNFRVRLIAVDQACNVSAYP